jgi:hypothetical protein
MKNIHVIPTDKPSSLFEIDGHLIINKEQLIQPKYYRNIYITSDEEIKDGDWHLNIVTNKISKYNIGLLNPNRSSYKKIILTTDQDLIKDGVQAIDDEFLEWFVKNPSCEFVETKRLEDGKFVDRFADGTIKEGIYENYKLIIPQEEPNFNMKNEIEWVSNNPKCKQIESCYNSLSKKCICPQEESKQYQVKRLYSEEEVKQFAFECVTNFLSNSENKVEIGLVDVILDRNNKKFEQFKNKQQ